MGFFNLYKPKEYKYRYIYYDPKKEARLEREKQLANEQNAKSDSTYRPGIRRGSFREAIEKNKGDYGSQIKKSNTRLILIILLLLVLFYFLLT